MRIAIQLAEPKTNTKSVGQMVTLILKQKVPTCLFTNEERLTDSHAFGNDGVQLNFTSTNLMQNYETN